MSGELEGPDRHVILADGDGRRASHDFTPDCQCGPVSWPVIGADGRPAIAYLHNGRTP